MLPDSLIHEHDEATLVGDGNRLSINLQLF